MSARADDKATSGTVSTTDGAATELGENELVGVTGGAAYAAESRDTQAVLGRWKVSSMDGKGNDVIVEDVTLVGEKIVPK